MSRAARLLELMELLRRRRAPVTGTELSRELGISIRTLYRDIATLQSHGADIHGEPGLGYVLRPGFTLPPLMFSTDELEALLLGSRWVTVRGDERLRAAARIAVGKIRAVLPSELRDLVDEATSTVPMMAPEAPAVVDVSMIREAIRAERRITIAYRDQAGTVSRRTIWPILIGYFERARIVAAWCELRQDYRAFRVDRILALETSDADRYPRKRATMVREWRARLKVETTAGN